MISLKLSEQDIKSFNTNGYFVVDDFLNDNFVEKIKERFDLIFKGEFETGMEPDEYNWKEGRDPSDLTRQICNGWKSDNIIKKIV